MLQMQPILLLKMISLRLNRLKYVQLYFPPQKPQNYYVNNNRPDADRQSVVNSAYVRHANAGDYFTGGMDSSDTEATLLSRNSSQPGGMFAICFSLHKSYLNFKFIKFIYINQR